MASTPKYDSLLLRAPTVWVITCQTHPYTRMFMVTVCSPKYKTVHVLGTRLVMRSDDAVYYQKQLFVHSEAGVRIFWRVSRVLHLAVS